MVKVIAFDVNETLLNLDGLDPLFARSFGDGPEARREWFTQMIQNALVSIVTDHYHPFGEIGRAALAMTAARRGVLLTDEERDAILSELVLRFPVEDGEPIAQTSAPYPRNRLSS